MPDHGLGRRYSPDPDDRKYLMQRRLGAPGMPLPSRKSWRIGPPNLDQGSTGTCVGQAWHNFLRCAPIRTVKRAPSPFDIYDAAILIDEWSSNDNDTARQEGTSVRAGAEVVTAKGRLKTFLWAFALQSAIDFVLTEGPVVLGTDWPNWKPDAEGIVRITATTKFIGGHAYLWRGVDTKRGLALCSNSWGDAWGKSGDFYIPFSDLERLIHQQGEVCTAIEQKLQPKTVMPVPTTQAAA